MHARPHRFWAGRDGMEDKMKRHVKKIISMGAILLLVGMVLPGASVTTKAAEPDEGVVTAGVTARVQIPEEEVYSNVSRSLADGIVTGSGVRLRKKPSTSATILELMNNGEYVNIEWGMNTAKWYYLQRIKTGTYGYASKDYITPF